MERRAEGEVAAEATFEVEPEQRSRPTTIADTMRVVRTQLLLDRVVLVLIATIRARSSTA